MDGEPTVRIHGEDVPVRAQVREIDGFSAHADHAEVDRWLAHFEPPPRMTFCVHGEPLALESQRARLAARGWKVAVPAYLEKVPLD